MAHIADDMVECRFDNFILKGRAVTRSGFERGTKTMRRQIID
jgi:hypothetical protein